MEDLLKFLLNIRRFPSVEIWVDDNENYNALCSPSFEEVLGSSCNLEGAIMDLVMRLEGYFTEEEKKELETMGYKMAKKDFKIPASITNPGTGDTIKFDYAKIIEADEEPINKEAIREWVKRIKEE